MRSRSSKRTTRRKDAAGFHDYADMAEVRQPRRNSPAYGLLSPASRRGEKKRCQGISVQISRVRKEKNFHHGARSPRGRELGSELYLNTDELLLI